MIVFSCVNTRFNTASSAAEPKPPSPPKPRPVLWTRCSPSEPYYELSENGKIRSTPKLVEIEDKFQENLFRNDRVRAQRTPFTFPARKPKLRTHHCCDGSNSDHSCDSESEYDSDDDNAAYEELQRKRTHPWRLHDDLWYNSDGEVIALSFDSLFA